MLDVQKLIELDKSITLAINGSDSLFIDGFANVFTSIAIWIPMAALVVFMIIRNLESKRLAIFLVLLVITVILCDQVSSSIFKPLFERFRPTHDLSIMDKIDTVNGYRGGLYGFISGHATNSFGISLFVALAIHDKRFTVSALIWAALNSLIRVYLGVHFFGDIFCGAIIGSIIASLMYLIYYNIPICRKSRVSSRYTEKIYTRSGFLLTDVRILLLTLYSTYFLITILVLLGQGIRML